MKKLLLLLIALAYGQYIQAQTLLKGRYYQDYTIRNTNSPYLLAGNDADNQRIADSLFSVLQNNPNTDFANDAGFLNRVNLLNRMGAIHVEPNVTLTIEQGTTISANAEYDTTSNTNYIIFPTIIYVEGTLNATGVNFSNVIFVINGPNARLILDNCQLSERIELTNGAEADINNSQLSDKICVLGYRKKRLGIEFRYVNIDTKNLVYNSSYTSIYKYDRIGGTPRKAFFPEGTPYTSVNHTELRMVNTSMVGVGTSNVYAISVEPISPAFRIQGVNTQRDSVTQHYNYSKIALESCTITGYKTPISTDYTYREIPPSDNTQQSFIIFDESKDAANSFPTREDFPNKDFTDITLRGNNQFRGNSIRHFSYFRYYENRITPSESRDCYGNIDIKGTLDIPVVIRLGASMMRYDSLYLGGGIVLKVPLGNEVGYGINYLEAIGEEGNEVVFTSDRDDNELGDTNRDGESTGPSAGDWYGVYTNTGHIIQHCKISYANYGVIARGGRIENNIISNCKFGASFQSGSSSTIFQNNTLATSEKTPIVVGLDVTPQFSGNTFSGQNNQYIGIGFMGGGEANGTLKTHHFAGFDNATYVLLNDITVPNGGVLNIDSGVVMKGIDGTQDIYVKRGGTLNVNGTANHPVVFTSIKDDNEGSPGDLNQDGTGSTPNRGEGIGIVFEEAALNTSRLSYLKLKYASVSGSFMHDGSNVSFSNVAIAIMPRTSPTIEHCQITNAYRGIYCEPQSKPIIRNNSFQEIGEAPLYMAFSAQPILSDNTFESGVGIQAIGLLSRTVLLDATLSKRKFGGYDNISYYLSGAIGVKSGVKVTIDPGVVIKHWGSGSEWDIYGGMKVNGTADEPVVFTSIYDDNFGNPQDTQGNGSDQVANAGDWNSIQFLSTSDDAFSTINHARIVNSTNGLVCTTAAPTLNNLVVDAASEYGLLLQSKSNPITNGLTIQNCAKDPVGMSVYANPQFTGTTTFSGNATSGIQILSETLTEDATLSKRSLAGFTNISYVLRDLITVAEGAIFTLDPGVIIKGGTSRDGNRIKYADIRVNGGLKAIGSTDSKIYFTALSDDAIGGDTNNDGTASTPNPGGWQGIYFSPTSLDEENTLQYCDIRYGRGGNYTSISYPGVITMQDCKVTIANSIIQQANAPGITIIGTANPIIKNNTFNSINDVAIQLSLLSNPSFEGNLLSNVSIQALGVEPETFTEDATVPMRSFAGYDNITYYLRRNTRTSFKVANGAKLTMPAGLVFKSSRYFLGGSGNRYGFAEWEINGGISIEGTSTKPVVFTRLEDDTYGNPKDTQGNGQTSESGWRDVSDDTWIGFSDTSDDASMIDHAVFGYGRVSMNNASPNIQNSLFEKGSYGLVLSGVSAPTVTNNTFNDLRAAPISTSLLSYPRTTSGNTISGTTLKGIKVRDETLTQDVTLLERSFAGIDNIPYLFNQYTVGSGVTLTINPGVICKFFSNGGLDVNYGLVAKGTADKKVVFTSIEDDSYGGDTDSNGSQSTISTWDKWRAINFKDASVDAICQIDHAIVKYGAYGSSGNNGALTMESASPKVTNTLFTNNNVAIRAEGAANPVINDCDFKDNGMAINNAGQTFNIDATNNWWGGNSGPTHSSNPAGTGEEVTDMVNFTPFKTDITSPEDGDVSLNGVIQAYDASIVLRHVVGSLSLTDAQKAVADVSGDGNVTAFDASQILQYAVGLISSFPANTGGRLMSPSMTVAMEDVSTDGEKAIVTTTLTDLRNIYASSLVWKFDPTAIRVEHIEVTGLRGVQISHHIMDGEIRLAMAHTTAIEASEVQISFHIIQENPHIGMASIAVEQVKANEHAFTTNADALINFGSGLKTQFGFYPNPLDASRNLQVLVPYGTSNLNIVLYTASGQEVGNIAQHQTPPAQLKLSLSEKIPFLEAGIYFLEFTSDQHREVQRIVIR